MISDVKVGAAHSIEHELLMLFSRQGRRMPVPVFLAAAMIGALAYGRVPTHCLSAWMLLVGLVLAARRYILGRLPELPNLSDSQGLRVAIALSALNGVTHGLSLFFFPALPELQRAIQSLLLVGLCTGSVASTAGYAPVFLAYLIPVMAPLVTLWAILRPDARHAWIDGATALIIAIFGAVLVALAADSFRLFRESFDIRLQQAALNRQLQRALSEAELANRAKTRFLAAASHDLRQPIHALSLFSAAMAIRPLDPLSREISQHMDEALRALSAQLDALLDVSKLDAGVVQVKPISLRLAPFLMRLREEFLPVASAKRLLLSLECACDPVVHTDEVLLGRLVCNLIDNAIKYTASGAVRLSLLAQRGQVVLGIEDSGCGIPEAEQARVFEEFYQLDNPERCQSKGLGLGLSIVKRLAELLDARLEMISRPGIGTGFYLLLAQQQPRAEDAAADERPGADLAGKRVLVVDDESSVRLGMKVLLEGLGARVTLADATAQALAAARRERPDLLLVDFRLRGGDSGLATVLALRQLYPELPAVLISGDTAPERLREAKQANIPLLHKPVPLAILRQALADFSTLQRR